MQAPKRQRTLHETGFAAACTAEIAPPSASLFTAEHRAALQRDGYVVVENVLDGAECAAALQQMYEFFARWDARLQPDAPWQREHMPLSGYGLVQFVAHERFQWTVRQHPRVAQVFAELHQVGADQLCTSFDGFSYYRRECAPRRGAKWMHCDLGNAPLPAGLPDCVQASVALLPSMGPADGAFVAHRGAHRTHERFFALHPNEKPRGDLYRYPPWFLEQLTADARAYLRADDPQHDSTVPVPMPRARVYCDAGSMLLWSSRLPHQNEPPLPQGNHRAVIFVSMLPRVFSTAADHEARARALRDRLATTHWAGANRVHVCSARPHSQNPQLMRAFKAHAPYEAPDPRAHLTALGRTLAGCSL